MTKCIVMKRYTFVCLADFKKKQTQNFPRWGDSQKCVAGSSTETTCIFQDKIYLFWNKFSAENQFHWWKAFFSFSLNIKLLISPEPYS